MSSKELPVYAVIPAYNNDATLSFILQDVLEQEYNKVFVLDDKSTDHTLGIADEFRKDIEIIGGSKNLGSAGNRNRIIPELGEQAIIHFLDADVRLNSERAPEQARELGSIANIGFVGGLIRNPDGTQNPYNYGPRMSLKASIWSSGIQYAIYSLGLQHPELAQRIRGKLDTVLKDWPNTFEEPTPRPIYWNSKANLVVPSHVFSGMGGYDPRLRYHEIMDFSIRVHKAGLNTLFNPALDATHKTVDNLDKKFNTDAIKATAQIIGNMGIKDWVLPPEEAL